MRKIALMVLFVLAIVSMACAQPDIVINADQDSISFGQIPIGTTATYGFFVVNAGDEVLEVNVSLVGEAFALTGADQYMIQPRARNVIIEVSFTPPEEQFYQAMLTLNTNDPDTPEIVINLMGQGIGEQPPEIEEIFLLAPEDNAQVEEFPLTFSWEGLDQEGADYFLEMANIDSMRFQTYVFEAHHETSIVLNEGDILDDQTYMWQVYAEHGNQIIGRSEIRMLSVGEADIPGPPPGRIQLISPEDDAYFDNLPVDFSWEAFDGNDITYSIEFMQFAGEWDTLRTESFTIEVGPVTNITLTDEELDNNAIYIWNVNVWQNDELVAISDSRTLYIGIDAPPPLPGDIELIAPAHHSQFDELPITFSWERYNEEAEYVLEIYSVDSLNFEPLFINTGLNNQYTINEGQLDYDCSYLWLVQAWDDGEIIAASDIWLFTLGDNGGVIPRQPIELVAPIDNAAYNQLPITFSWVPRDSLENANYTLEITDFNDPPTEHYVFQAGRNLFYTLEEGDIPNPNVYRWYVRSWINGELLGSSEQRTLFLGDDGPTPPQGEVNLLLPEDEANIDDLPLLFTWEEYDSSDAYILRLINIVNDQQDSVFNNVTNIEVGNNLSYLVERGEIETGLTYYWEVKAYFQGHLIGSSDLRTLYLGLDVPNPPGSFALLSPEDNATVTTLPMTFSWEATDIANEDQVNYTLILSPGNLNDYDELMYEVGSNTSFEINHLNIDESATYEWYVVAFVDGRQVAQSTQHWSFSLEWDAIWASMDVANNSNLTPQEFAISSVFPNPFNPEVTIGISIPEASRITAKVYDVLGREVSVVHNGVLSVGVHNFQWHGISAGVYFLRVNNESGWSEVKRLVLMK